MAFYDPTLFQYPLVNVYAVTYVKSNVNCCCVFAEEETHKVDLTSLSNKLLPGLTTLGFKDDRRHKGMPTSAFLFFIFPPS